jgi:hypothetical protein
MYKLVQCGYILRHSLWLGYTANSDLIHAYYFVN